MVQGIIFEEIYNFRIYTHAIIHTLHLYKSLDRAKRNTIIILDCIFRCRATEIKSKSNPLKSDFEGEIFILTSVAIARNTISLFQLLSQMNS